MKKISIRFGIKGVGMFPNAGIFVKSLPEDQATLVIEGLIKLRAELARMGNHDLADKLVAEYR
jgi:predicted Fe-Mo cluster-binding NifX family protein